MISVIHFVVRIVPYWDRIRDVVDDLNIAFSLNSTIWIEIIRACVTPTVTV